ncbi:MAG: hypothetical protein F9K13_13220 [Candidatus Methylomirabilis oxygeniifera]|nr:MAG: hypothetical protein F9K13_13220 [Candidatus Methylomirabilis oxyfera]
MRVADAVEGLDEGIRLVGFGRMCPVNILHSSLWTSEGRGVAMYRCEAETEAGFVQQLAVSYLGHGFCFYVAGEIPATKDPATIDAKLIARYGIGISRWARARRKKAGFANMHYLRFGRFFVLLATHGEHRFFRDEPRFKDARRDPIRFAGYSISLKRGRDGRLHPSVRIHPDEYRKLKAYFLDLAPHRTIENLAAAFAAVPFERYAPVRRQLLNIWRAANRAREQAGYEPAPLAILRLRRRVVRAFPEQGEPARAAA